MRSSFLTLRPILLFLTIHGQHHYLWRAVDQDGHALDVQVQHQRDKKAAKTFLGVISSPSLSIARRWCTDSKPGGRSRIRQGPHKGRVRGTFPPSVPGDRLRVS
jgi:DDE domain